MKRSRRTHAIGLVLLLLVAVGGAQVAGVGGTRSKSTSAAATKALSTISGGAVVDVGSTELANQQLRARAGDVVQMRSTAKLRATATGRAQVAQVVCGIRYSRAGDASWSLGDPYETVVLRTSTARTVTIERSFTAPAADTYRAATACHVASPADGARVVATGAMRLGKGLPTGAAVPVDED